MLIVSFLSVAIPHIEVGGMEKRGFGTSVASVGLEPGSRKKKKEKKSLVVAWDSVIKHK